MKAEPDGPATRRPVAGTRVGDAQSFPMSPTQERIWHAHRRAPASGRCNVQRVLRLRGPLRASRLVRGLEALVERHESLRTAFPDAGGTQRVHRRAAPAFTTIDLSAVSPDGRDAAVRQLALDDARRPFDIALVPLVRACLVRFGDDEHVLVFTVHNIVCDGWSLGILFREWAAAYASEDGETFPTPAPPIQYADCATWQRGRIDDGAAGHALAYWKAKLAGLPPSPRWRDGMATGDSSARRVEWLPAPIAEAVSGFAQRESVTPFTAYLTAFLILLARARESDDVVVGTPIAGRDDLEMRPVVGLFVDLLAIRGDLRGEPSFADLARRLRDTVTEAVEHRAAPFQRLADSLDPDDGTDRAPLVDVVINYTGDRQRIPGRWHDLDVEPLDVEAGPSPHALMLFVRDEGRIKLELVHRLSASVTRDAGTFLADYRGVLERACANPARSIGRL